MTLLPFAEVFVAIKVSRLETFEVEALKSFTVHPFDLQTPLAVLSEVLVLPLATVTL